MTATQRAFFIWWRDLERWVTPNQLFSPKNLPEDWSLVRIGELVKQVSLQVRVQKDQEYKMIGVKWYGEGTFNRETVLGQSISARYLTPVAPNAFIYNRLFAWKESFAVVPLEHGDCFVSNEFPQFIVDSERILSRYLYLFFTLNNTIRAVNASSIGSAAVSRNRFKEEYFLEFEIPLPPIAIQRAIVDRWQTAQAEIKAISERLKNQDREILLSIQVTLGRERSELEMPKAFALWWSEMEKWGVEMCWRERIQHKQCEYITAKISDVCEIGSGGTPSRRNPSYFGGDIPWVKTTEVRNAVIYQTEESITHTGLNNSSAKVYPLGSIIIAMYGQGATRGRTAKLGVEAATNQACAVLTEFTDDVDPDFVWVYLMSEYDGLRELASGNNQPNLNADMIANYPIPLPPLDVQKAIVQRVEVGRQAIAREREAADRKKQEIEAEIEALILGTQAIEVMEA